MLVKYWSLFLWDKSYLSFSFAKSNCALLKLYKRVYIHTCIFKLEIAEIRDYVEDSRYL